MTLGIPPPSFPRRRFESAKAVLPGRSMLYWSIHWHFGHALTQLHCAQLHWSSARTSYAAIVEAADAARAPHSKSVRYKKDALVEWGYFLDGVFHTADGDARPVKRIALAGPPASVHGSDSAARHLANGAAAAAGVDSCPEPQGSPQDPCRHPATAVPVPARAQTAVGVATVDVSEAGSPAKRPRHDLSSAKAAAVEAGASTRACSLCCLCQSSTRMDAFL